MKAKTRAFFGRWKVRFSKAFSFFWKNGGKAFAMKKGQQGLDKLKNK